MWTCEWVEEGGWLKPTQGERKKGLVKIHHGKTFVSMAEVQKRCPSLWLPSALSSPWSFWKSKRGSHVMNLRMGCRQTCQELSAAQRPLEGIRKDFKLLVEVPWQCLNITIRHNSELYHKHNQSHLIIYWMNPQILEAPPCDIMFSIMWNPKFLVSPK